MGGGGHGCGLRPPGVRPRRLHLADADRPPRARGAEGGQARDEEDDHEGRQERGEEGDQAVGHAGRCADPERQPGRPGVRLHPRGDELGFEDLDDPPPVLEARQIDRIETELLLDDDEGYRDGLDPHGTHIAGIIAADHDDPDDPRGRLAGICPDIRLWDFRVIGPDGRGDEFAVVSALQHIRRINAREGRLVIHGVNLSLALPHDPANYACGWTRACIECDLLVRSGVVVVAAAGNAGFDRSQVRSNAEFAAYRTVSITDPGNTESVITAGSTHRSEPYRYGVSYFSSRGPTADGRQKPDLLAPGERIYSTFPDGDFGTLDGTSQAAAHVSGAAALILARHPELIGRPELVKAALCRSATDLGRERAFQGHGLVEILRALESL